MGKYRIGELSLLSVSIVMLIVTGCAKIYYDVALEAVERPAEAKVRYGEQKIKKVAAEGVLKYCFEDEMVSIIWIPKASSALSFALTNKTDHSIKIVWDEAAFVDCNGESHRIIHSGVRYIDRNTPQPPSVVARRGTITDIIVPSDNVYFVSGQYGGWQEMPLLPVAGSDREKEAKAKSYIGKTVEVLLPLEIEGIVNEYIFTFKVENAELKYQ